MNAPGTHHAMHFVPLSLAGAYVIEPEPNVDERGSFERIWCREEFGRYGVDIAWVQSSLSYNTRGGTLRGLHYQADPFPEAKLVRCMRGAAFDVIVDLRAGSSTCGMWESIELSAENRRTLYVPHGFAHGYQTRCDDTELLYFISEFYRPELARGIRWNDEALAIDWPPCESRTMSQRDLSLPSWQR